MIKINIEITDTPLKDGTFYGNIMAMPENVEPVSDHELFMRDMIMQHLEKLAMTIAKSEQVTKAIVGRIPLQKIRRRKKDERS